MEDLLYQFDLLSDRAFLEGKAFDPSSIDVDLMNLFEIESYKAWAAAELQLDAELRDAETSLSDAEASLESAMDEAMEEFRRFEAEAERECAAELLSLVEVAEAARRMGRSLEKAATVAANKYVEAALESATASVRNAWKGLSQRKKKVHPS